MRIESKLCHVSENKAVVQVIGWMNDKNVGSALAEGATVEYAEDRAISRLNERLNTITKKEEDINFNNEKINKSKLIVELPKSEKLETNNSNNEPNDWSSELTAIDSEINRLNWTRDDEIRFLEKNLGYNNRNKITNYNELINYLTILKRTEGISSSKTIKNNIESIIEESNIVLKDLSWDNIQGREFLQKEFNVSTRMELDEEQLISFVAKLKSIRNQKMS